MTLETTQGMEILRQSFKQLNKFMMLLWRLGLGSYGNGTRWGGYIMVIVHKGRKTGLIRRTPVNYTIIGDDIYCTAGFGARADWFRNVMADPNVEVWLPDGWWAGVAENVSDTSERIEIMRKVLIASGFATYAAGIDPIKLSDDELDEVTTEYRLVRIRRVEPRTGSGGPGDLVWVWPLTTLVFGVLLLFSKRNRRK
jgi:deazaflavin-dependent oxidoreductase (nitroreductase family)